MLSEPEARNLLELLKHLGDYRVGLNEFAKNFSAEQYHDIYKDLVDAHQSVTSAGFKVAKLLNIDLIT